MTYDASMTHNSGERDELVPIPTTWREELRKWWIVCRWLVYVPGYAAMCASSFWIGSQIGEWMRQ